MKAKKNVMNGKGVGRELMDSFFDGFNNIRERKDKT